MGIHKPEVAHSWREFKLVGKTNRCVSVTLARYFRFRWLRYFEHALTSVNRTFAEPAMWLSVVVRMTS